MYARRWLELGARKWPGVEGIRDHCAMLSDRYETPFHMAGYAMVEALRDQNVEKVALNACYHDRSWYQGTVGFLQEAGFDVVWAGNFVDQGWFNAQTDVDRCVWCFDESCSGIRLIMSRIRPRTSMLISSMV